MYKVSYVQSIMCTKKTIIDVLGDWLLVTI